MLMLLLISKCVGETYRIPIGIEKIFFQQKKCVNDIFEMCYKNVFSLGSVNQKILSCMSV